jgi:enoyl-CoA hydratase
MIPLIIDSIVSSGVQNEIDAVACWTELPREITVNYETLLCEVKDQVARVTLNRPEVMNALNARVFNELEHVFMTLALDAGVRVVLLMGAGEKAFAAGADINELSRLDVATGEAKAKRGQEVFRMIETFGKPVIACINGFALGGGCELAMACTIRLASETARLGQPEVKLGLIPGYGGTQRLPRLVGRSMALKLLLTGEMIGAAEALRIRLVDEVVPANRLMERAGDLAKTIVGMAPLAIAGCMESVRWGDDLGFVSATDVEAEIFGRLCGTEDKAEGTKAFLEKRAAVWVGK